MKQITVSNDILMIHPKSPLAGLTLQVATLTAEQKKVNGHLKSYGVKIGNMTPVLHDGMTWYVENEYIEKVEEVGTL